MAVQSPRLRRAELHLRRFSDGCGCAWQRQDDSRRVDGHVPLDAEARRQEGRSVVGRGRQANARHGRWQLQDGRHDDALCGAARQQCLLSRLLPVCTADDDGRSQHSHSGVLMYAVTHTGGSGAQA